MAHCLTWQDHEFGEPVFLEAGRHETMGRYQRFTVTCARCGRRTTETRWLDLSGSSRPVSMEEP